MVTVFMKKVILLLFGTLIAIYFFLTPATPNEKAVHDFFSQKGLKVNCKLVDSRVGLKVLSDDRAFAILADTGYTALLGENRILAYSTVQPWKKDIALNAVLDFYEQMLALALRSKEPYLEVSKAVYEPLLGMEWGQNAPFNDLCPTANGQPTKAGCLPVALGQLIGYHIPEYQQEPVSLIATLGGLLEARYSVENTVASTHKVKGVLTKHYGFSASCRIRKGLTNRQLLELAERNIKEGNPILLTNREHAFLADGMEGDYLHLNQGIGGPCNGYYRILCVHGKQWELPFATSIMTDMHPGKELPAQIHVQQPGSLGVLLGDSALQVTHLRVSGTLNGKDVALLRRMAGAVDGTTAPVGSLTKIQFEKVRYVSGDVFEEVDAVAEKFVIRQKKETFDFSKLTDSRWKTFCAKGYDKTEDYRVVKEDGTYKIQFILSPIPNPTYFYMDCENLR